MPQLLLKRFQELFEGKKYIHRNSTLGDSVARCLPEDLFVLGRSRPLVERIASGTRVLNTQNVQRGVASRRGDGTFGELIPGVQAVREATLKVARSRCNDRGRYRGEDPRQGHDQTNRSGAGGSH